MALRFLSDVLLKLQLRSIIVAPVTVSLEFFTDNVCQNASVTMRTNTNVFLGRRGDINGVNSINASMLDRGCMGIKHLICLKPYQD